MKHIKAPAEGKKIISADYSQIELRLIAELSGEDNMIKAFQNGEDIHASTASKLFKIPLDQVDKTQRSQAKTVNFGIIYGQGAFALAEQTGLSRTEAKQMIDSYYENYPKLKIFMTEQVEKARKNGFVETILGRKRHLKDINSNNFVVRGHAERNAVNAPIQGSAADIIKVAMIDIDKVETLPADKVLILCTGTQGEPLAALSRIANGSHKYISLREGDTVVISATPIPGNEKAAYKNINQLMKRHANVVFERGVGIHVSGHGCQEEQKLMLNLIKPKFFMPVHGEFVMLKKHKELAEAVGIPSNNIILAENGMKLELTKSNFKAVGKVPSGVTLIDGFGIGDIGNAVLKDRQNLADDGIVIISISQYKTGKFNKQIELVTRGFVYNKDAESLLSETKELIRLELENMETQDVKEIGKIKQRLKLKIGEFLNKKTDREPIILPIIMEV